MQSTKGSRRLVRHKIGMWTDDTLEKAMYVVTNNAMKLRVASKVLRIPTSSLAIIYKGKQELDKEVPNQH